MYARGRANVQLHVLPSVVGQQIEKKHENQH
jgi:hypothetical protein